MPIDVAGTLGDLVTEDSRRMRVLEQLGLDYCCNGHRTLAEASTSAGLDPAVVAESLVFAEPPAVAERGPRENTDLAHEIVDTHHAYMWEEMPRLKALVDKVEGVHGTAHPEPAQVKAAFDEALGALEPHMTKEERQIFPAIVGWSVRVLPPILWTLPLPSWSTSTSTSATCSSASVR